MGGSSDNSSDQYEEEMIDKENEESQESQANAVMADKKVQESAIQAMQRSVRGVSSSNKGSLGS